MTRVAPATLSDLFSHFWLKKQYLGDTQKWRFDSFFLQLEGFSFRFQVFLNILSSVTSFQTGTCNCLCKKHMELYRPHIKQLNSLPRSQRVQRLNVWCAWYYAPYTHFVSTHLCKIFTQLSLAEHQNVMTFECDNSFYPL